MIDKSKVRVLSSQTVDLFPDTNIDGSEVIGSLANVVSSKVGHEVDVYVALPVDSEDSIQKTISKYQDAMVVCGMFEKAPRGILRFLIEFITQSIQTTCDFPSSATVEDVYKRFNLEPTDSITIGNDKLDKSIPLSTIYGTSNILYVTSEFRQKKVISRQVISKYGEIRSVLVPETATLANVARKYMEKYGVPLNSKPVFIYTEPTQGATPQRAFLKTPVANLNPEGRLIISFGQPSMHSEKQSSDSFSAENERPITSEKVPAPIIKPENVQTLDVPEPKPEPIIEPKPEPKTEQKPEPKTEQKPSEFTFKFRIMGDAKHVNEISIPCTLPLKDLPRAIRESMPERFIGSEITVKRSTKPVPLDDTLVSEYTNLGKDQLLVRLEKAEERKAKGRTGEAVCVSPSDPPVEVPAGDPIRFNVRFDDIALQYEAPSEMTLEQLIRKVAAEHPQLFGRNISAMVSFHFRPLSTKLSELNLGPRKTVMLKENDDGANTLPK